MDIRTDRWEIAAGAMDVVHKNKAAKSEKKLKYQIHQKRKTVAENRQKTVKKAN